MVPPVMHPLGAEVHTVASPLLVSPMVPPLVTPEVPPLVSYTLMVPPLLV